MNPEEPHEPHQNPQPQPQHMSARVPERVGPGVFSTGVLVMTGNTEFILDFVQNLGQPRPNRRARGHAPCHHAAIYPGIEDEPGDVHESVRKSSRIAATEPKSKETDASGNL